MSEPTDVQRELMRMAISMAEENVRNRGGGPFAALIVREGRVVARGVNRVTATRDPTAHAEIVAIREACRSTGSFRLDGMELYATCEPCPMCLGAAYWAGLGRVVFAATRSDAGRAGFDDEHIYRETCAPIFNRVLPFEQLMRDEANAVFRMWETDPDREPY